MMNHKWIPFTRGVTFPVFILCLIFDLMSCQCQGSTALAAQPPQGNTSSVTPHGSTAPSPTEALTRARAKQIALANNPSLDSALERIKQAREAVAQARAGYLPTLSAASGINYTESTSNSVPGARESLYTARISATQVLFDGFSRKYSNLAADYGEKKSRAALLNARRILSWSVAQAVLNAQLAQENIQIAQSDMKFNRDQETEASAKEQVGTGSYSDMLNFKTKVNTAKSALLTAQQDFTEAIHGLAALMGYGNARLPGGMSLAPLKPHAVDSLRYSDVDALVDNEIQHLALNRPDLKQAEMGVQEARAQAEVARSDYFPTLSLTGAYGTQAGDGFDDTDSMGASLGINVSFDLFTGGTTGSKIRQALSAQRELEKNMNDTTINAMADIHSSMEKISTARLQLDLQKENTTLIKTTRDLVQLEYQSGQTSLVRLNEAQNELVSAMGNLAIAQISLALALEEFDYYTGQNL